MRKVRHKNVVQFIGACTRKPNLCIVVEYMPGGSVYDYMRRVRSFWLSGSAVLLQYRHAQLCRTMCHIAGTACWPPLPAACKCILCYAATLHSLPHTLVC